MQLHDVWFVLIAVLWTGYFFLEGFDFGVGVLTKLLARDRTEQRVLINTIGPVWDGNEVWLLSRGRRHLRRLPRVVRHPLLRLLPAAAAHPGLPDRARASPSSTGRSGPRRTGSATGRHAIFWTSLLPAFLWGVAFANIVRGVKIDADIEYVGNLADLLNPYALLGGLVTLSLFTFHGAVFVRAQDRRGHPGAGAEAGRSRSDSWPPCSRSASWSGPRPTTATAGAWPRRSWPCSPWSPHSVRALTGREGWSFAFSGVTIVAAVAMLFLTLFPNVMPSSLNADWNLTVTNASSSPYTLKIMTWCAGIATPMVLLYQGWTYWVFRKRIGTQHIAEAAH